MTSFEYASGLISIVVGLAVARVLGGVGAFLNADRRTSSDWIVGAWCIILSIALVAWWVAGWRFLRQQAEISFASLVFWMFATAVLYLAAYLLVPRNVASLHGDDRDTNFDLPNRAFFVCLAVHYGAFLLYVVTDLALVVESSPVTNGRLPFLPMLIIASAAGIFVRTPRGYVVHLAIWGVMLIAAIAISLPALG